MPRVLITTPFPAWPLLRQTPGHAGRWEDFEFVVNEPVETCDAWVVFEEVPETLRTRCPRENTVFVSAEPPAIRRYRRGFLDQFRWVLTCHEIDHRGHIPWHQGHPWHAGVDREANNRSTWDYDSISSHDAAHKPHLLSTVISTKSITPAHRQRQAFVALLKAELGDAFHVYGRGYLPIADKWDAVAPYRFHLALENECRKNYVTEKVSDAFLGSAYAFYFGATNATDFFPANSFSAIDVFEPETAIATIKQAIAEDFDRTHRDAVREARRRVLDEHNFFPLVVRLLRERMSGAPPQPVELLPRRQRVQLALRRLGRRIAA